MVNLVITTDSKSKESRLTDNLALGFLFLSMIVICSITWQKWGSVTVDCGREMYVPSAINEGKRLYFDIWYPYGPLIPHWNALLYRVFGTHLSVLYTSGISIVTIIIIALYSLSRIFLPACLSFTAVFAFILQAFQLSIFNYVLPYSYPAAYGSMLLVVLLWVLVADCFEARTWRIFAAGLIAGLILLTKIEFGLAAYALLTSAIIIRAIDANSLRKLTQDISLCAPGFLLCLGVYGSLVSISSFAFIFEENITISPQSYFVKTFGKMYAQHLGFSTNLFDLIKSILGSLLSTVGLITTVYIGSLFYRAVLVVILTLICGICSLHLFSFINIIDLLPRLLSVARFFFFNSGLIWLSVILLIITMTNWRRNDKRPYDSAVLMLTICSITIGFRVLTQMMPARYSIFYDTLVYLSWLVALYTLSQYLPIQQTEWIWKRFSILLCWGLTFSTAPYYNLHLYHQEQFLVNSSRGNIYTDRWTSEGYTELLDFLGSVKSRSELFVTIPDDVSLYYFSAILAPSRWHTLSPGILPPGELTSSYLQELDRLKVKYVILSNRSTPEYGVPIFGKDYNNTVYQWLEQNYKKIGQVGDYNRVVHPSHWGALIYKRNTDRTLTFPTF